MVRVIADVRRHSTVESLPEIRLLLEHWRGTKVPLNPGASPAQIDELQKALGLTFPETLRQLYLAANGMPDRIEDAQFFSFWPLEQLPAQSKAWGLPADIPIILFGDFQLSMYAYGVLCDGPQAGSVQIFHGVGFGQEKVADSLSAFVRAIVNDPDSVGLG